MKPTKSLATAPPDVLLKISFWISAGLNGSQTHVCNKSLIFTTKLFSRWQHLQSCYFWFVMTSSKILIYDYLTKFSHNINKAILKSLCKFQVDIQINALFATVQSLKISIHIYWDSHVGWQINAYQPVFPLTLQKILQLLWPLTL